LRKGKEALIVISKKKRRLYHYSGICIAECGKKTVNLGREGESDVAKKKEGKAPAIIPISQSEASSFVLALGKRCKLAQNKGEGG